MEDKIIKNNILLESQKEFESNINCCSPLLSKKILVNFSPENNHMNINNNINSYYQNFSPKNNQIENSQNNKFFFNNKEKNHLNNKFFPSKANFCKGKVKSSKKISLINSSPIFQYYASGNNSPDNFSHCCNDLLSSSENNDSLGYFGKLNSSQSNSYFSGGFDYSHSDIFNTELKDRIFRVSSFQNIRRYMSLDNEQEDEKNKNLDFNIPEDDLYNIEFDDGNLDINFNDDNINILNKINEAKNIKLNENKNNGEEIQKNKNDKNNNNNFFPIEPKMEKKKKNKNKNSNDICDTNEHENTIDSNEINHKDNQKIKMEKGCSNNTTSIDNDGNQNFSIEYPKKYINMLDFIKEDHCSPSIEKNEDKQIKKRPIVITNSDDNNNNIEQNQKVEFDKIEKKNENNNFIYQNNYINNDLNNKANNEKMQKVKDNNINYTQNCKINQNILNNDQFGYANNNFNYYNNNNNFQLQSNYIYSNNNYQSMSNQNYLNNPNLINLPFPFPNPNININGNIIVNNQNYSCFNNNYYYLPNSQNNNNSMNFYMNQGKNQLSNNNYNNIKDSINNSNKQYNFDQKNDNKTDNTNAKKNKKKKNVKKLDISLYRDKPLSFYENNFLNLIKDQGACRYLQQLLDSNTEETIKTLFSPLCINLLKIINDPFANYFIQKIITFLNQEQLFIILTIISPSFFQISCNNYGTRVMQKLIFYLNSEKNKQYFYELITPLIYPLLKNLNGTFIVQKFAVQNMKNYGIKIHDIIIENSTELCKNRHGCSVIQKYIETRESTMIPKLLDKLIEDSLLIITDQFGNYVIQTILSIGDKKYGNILADKISTNIVYYAKDKYSTNVVEKCFEYCDGEHFNNLLASVQKKENMIELMLDEHGNYIVQKALSLSPPNVQKIMLDIIKGLFDKLKKLPFGNKIINRVNMTYLKGVNEGSIM